MSRVSFLNSLGRPVVRAGLYYPIETLAETAAAGGNTPEGSGLQDAFHETMYSLLRHQIDVDMIDGKGLLSGEVSEGTIKTGSQQFSVLIIPEFGILTEGLEEKIREFTRQGGIVMAYACPQNGSSNAGLLTEAVCPPEKLYERLFEKNVPDLRVLHGNRYGLFVNCRILDKERWYFLGSGADEEKELELWVRGKGSAQWLDPETGERRPVESVPEKDGLRLFVHLAPAQAGWLLLSEEMTERRPEYWQEDDCQQIGGRFEIQILNGDAKNEWRADLSGGRLKIPVCLFRSDLDERSREIRICNRETEEGSCGRHLSRWKGAWITRRAFWHDATEARDLYFRRKIYLEEEPLGGKICAAAVDTAEIFVNGQFCGRIDGYEEPGILSASNWKKGWNLLAVHVKNHHPIEDCDMCAADTLPADRYISLLLEAEIQTEGGTKRLYSDGQFIVCGQTREGWELPEADYETEARKVSWETAKPFGGSDPAWTYAWERGRLPLLPWGDLPLFGEKVEYPLNIFYQITLPAGTSRLYPPAVRGRAEYFLDGRKILKEGKTESFEADGMPHILQISVRAEGPEDGLLKPVEVETEPFWASLGDWRIHGLKWFSGYVRYRKKFTVRKRPGRYLLRLGQVCFHGEIWINGELAGVRLWEPYELDVTEQLREGENELTVIVSNLAASERRYMLVDEGKALGWNRYWNEDNIDRDGENLLSGLLGPVKLYHMYKAGRTAE